MTRRLLFSNPPTFPLHPFGDSGKKNHLFIPLLRLSSLEWLRSRLRERLQERLRERLRSRARERRASSNLDSARHNSSHVCRAAHRSRCGDGVSSLKPKSKKKIGLPVLIHNHNLMAFLFSSFPRIKITMFDGYWDFLKTTKSFFLSFFCR